MKRIAIFALALVLAGCAGGAGGTPGPTEGPAHVSRQCVVAMQPVTDALTELDSRLSVGLSFAAYGDKVGAIRVAFDRLSLKDLEPGCLAQVAKPEAEALDAYARAYNTWNGCQQNGCLKEAMQPRLQAEWTTAGGLIAKVKAALP